MRKPTERPPVGPDEWRGCARKRRYPDRGHAMKHGRATIAHGNEPCLWVYRCPFCRGWHLTKKPGDPRNAVHVID